MRVIGTIDGIDIVENDDKSVTYVSGATIDGDGANGQFGEPPCYAPAGYPGKTLDILRNAGHPGNWFGVVTDTGERDGQPIVQGAQDPKPGAYVSATSLHLPGKDGRQLPDSAPFKYVNSATVPFIAVPPSIIRGVAGVVLGCRAVVTNTRNGKTVEAVVVDQGPPTIWARSAWPVPRRSASAPARVPHIRPMKAGPTSKSFPTASSPEWRRS